MSHTRNLEMLSWPMKEQSDRRRNLGRCLKQDEEMASMAAVLLAEKRWKICHGSCWCLRLMGAPVARQQQLRPRACCCIWAWGTYLSEGCSVVLFFTSRLKVNLYAVDEMAFLGDLSKAGLGRVEWCMQALAALLAAHQGLSISAGNAGSAWSGAAQLQGGTANLIAYCH